MIPSADSFGALQNQSNLKRMSSKAKVSLEHHVKKAHTQGKDRT